MDKIIPLFQFNRRKGVVSLQEEVKNQEDEDIQAKLNEKSIWSRVKSVIDNEELVEKNKTDEERTAEEFDELIKELNPDTGAGGRLN